MKQHPPAAAVQDGVVVEAVEVLMLLLVTPLVAFYRIAKTGLENGGRP